jgi:hypothetical protein
MCTPPRWSRRGRQTAGRPHPDRGRRRGLAWRLLSAAAAVALWCAVSGVLAALSAQQGSPPEAPLIFHGAYRGTSSLTLGYGRAAETITAVGTAALLGTSRLRAVGSGLLNPSGCLPLAGQGRLSAAGRGTLT